MNRFRGVWINVTKMIIDKIQKWFIFNIAKLFT